MVMVVAVVVVVPVVVEIAHSQIQRLRAVETTVVNLVEEVEAADDLTIILWQICRAGSVLVVSWRCWK